MKAEAIERKRLLAHPALPHLIERYVLARAAWRGVASASAGTLVGFTERSYCDRYLLTLPPITWTSATSTQHPDRRHYDLAFERAGRRPAIGGERCDPRGVSPLPERSSGGEPCSEPEDRPATVAAEQPVQIAGRRAARPPEVSGTVTSWMPHTGPRAASLIPTYDESRQRG